MGVSARTEDASIGEATEVTKHFIEPLVQRTTPSIIADKLRLAIGFGELPPGSQLFETELAHELGVSRGPLREAVQRLAQEGLLVAIRNRGVFVIEMTNDRVRDMYLAREAIERAAAEQILRRGEGDSARRTLLGVVDEMRAGSEADDTSMTTAADLKFHETLVTLADSPRLSRIHSTLLTETRMCLTALQGKFRFGDDRVEEHRAIAEALGSAGDASVADGSSRTLVERLLVKHTERALSRLTATE